MTKITPRQCKAARALKDWLQHDLAKTSGIGLGSIVKFEKGEYISDAKIEIIINTFHKHCIEFLENEGVRLLSDLVHIYRDANCYDEFFADTLKDIEKKKSEVCVFIRTQDMLIRTCGNTHRNNLDRLNELNEKTKVRCILADVRLPSFAAPKFEIRNVPKHSLSPASFVTCGDRLSKIYLESNHYNICAKRISSLTKDYQDSFMMHWGGAHPALIDSKQDNSRLDLVVVA